jgi:hypothetical protein
MRTTTSTITVTTTYRATFIHIHAAYAKAWRWAENLAAALKLTHYRTLRTSANLVPVQDDSRCMAA